MVNKTAAMENCETSAIGRALGFMGIGVIEAIASVDEINKAQTQRPYKTYPAKPKASPEVTFMAAEKAIEDAGTITLLLDLQDRIAHSELLSDDQKRILNSKLSGKLDGLDPTN